MGEVAGGMTQVVNSYLAWDFDRFDVDVIVSRDGSRGIAALALFARAAWRILRLPQREKTVVVVHLSQDGSFIREGLLLELASRRGVATVAHLHGSSFVQYAKSNPGRVTKVLSHADAIVVLSDATLAAVRSLLPTAQAQIVPNAVLPGHPTPKTRTVVFGGSVGRRKGVDVLVEAWRDIADKDGWQLDVVGPIAEPAIVPDDLPSATFHGALRTRRSWRCSTRARSQCSHHVMKPCRCSSSRLWRAMHVSSRPRSGESSRSSGKAPGSSCRLTTRHHSVRPWRMSWVTTSCGLLSSNGVARSSIPSSPPRQCIHSLKSSGSGH